MNIEFVSSDVASLFLNSSFGVQSVISDNITAPIFPLTSPGITLSWRISKKTKLKTALYKGNQVDFSANPYNVKWNLNHIKSLLWVTEGQYRWTRNQEKNNTLKAGVFFHEHSPENNVVNSETGNILNYDFGLYMVGDHQVYLNGIHRLNIFYQLGASPRNDNFGYLGAGCTFTGLFSKSGEDVLGFAVADGMLTKARGRDETTFELTYKVQVSNQIYIQPEMQYVLHPGGTDVQLKNALVGLVRLGLEF